MPTSCPCPRFPNLHGAVPKPCLQTQRIAWRAARKCKARPKRPSRCVAAVACSPSCQPELICSLAWYRQIYLEAASIKTTCTSMFETSRPVLSQGKWRSPCTEDRWVLYSGVEAYCPELPWFVVCGSVPRDSADVRVRVVAGRLSCPTSPAARCIAVLHVGNDPSLSLQT